MNRLKKKVCKIIAHVNSKKVLNFYELLRFVHRSPSYCDKNYNHNRKAMLTHLSSIEKAAGYIEDQNNYDDMKYGKVTVAYAGCEIIAVYNALRSIDSLGENIDIFPELIKRFEKDGCVLSARFGTAPLAIKDYFQENDYENAIEINEEKYLDMQDQFDTFIYTFFNDKDDVSKEIHTINISKVDGRYVAHNLTKRMAIYSSINELTASINNGKAKSISLIGIKKQYVFDN